VYSDAAPARHTAAGHSLRAAPADGILLSMTTHYVLTQAVTAAQEIEAKGFLGTVGKIAAATIIFFIAVGLIVGLVLGFIVGRAVGRRSGPGA
jgi:uncharacterized protein YacL